MIFNRPLRQGFRVWSVKKQKI